MVKRENIVDLMEDMTTMEKLEKASELLESALSHYTRLHDKHVKKSATDSRNDLIDLSKLITPIRKEIMVEVSSLPTNKKNTTKEEESDDESEDEVNDESDDESEDEVEPEPEPVKKKTPVKKTTAKKTPVKKTATKKTPVKKTATKKGKSSK